MPIRTTSRFVTFRRDFTLGSNPEIFLAGRYEIEEDEEVTETMTRIVGRLVATTMIVASVGSVRACRVSPAELEAALAADAREQE